MRTDAFHIGASGQTEAEGKAMAAPLALACAVRLIDRRTGRTHRINGSPLIVFTKTPDVAVADLLSGRDAAVWEAHVEPFGVDASKVGGRA